MTLIPRDSDKIQCLCAALDPLSLPFFGRSISSLPLSLFLFLAVPWAGSLLFCQKSMFDYRNERCSLTSKKSQYYLE